MALSAPPRSREFDYPSLSDSEDGFRKLFASSSDALLITNATGAEFIDVNPRACQVFGYPRRELLGLSPNRILRWSESASDWRPAAAEKSLRGAHCRQKSGLAIACDISSWTIRVGDKPGILVAARVSSQRQLAETLSKTSAFARFANAVALGVAEAPTIEHAIRFCIRQVSDFHCWPLAHSRIFAKRFIAAHVPADTWYFGLNARSESQADIMIPSKLNLASSDWYPRIAITGRPFISEDLLADSDPAVKQLARCFGLKSALVTPILVDKEVIGTLEFFSHQVISLDELQSETMSGLGARTGHIVERKRAESRIQSLSSRLFHLQDDERRSLARELHDTTAQHIAAMLMDLSIIGRKAEALHPDTQTALSECISLARQSLHELRTFSYLLHPPLLDELGLVSALRIYVEGFSQRSGMRVDCELPDSCPKLPADLEVTLFHVVQEGLTNAHRHSGSPWAKIRMTLNATKVKVMIENETTSEPAKERPPQQPKMGVGIRSLHERVEHFGGRCVLHSDPYRTLLEAVLPLSPAAKGASGALDPAERI